MENIENLQNTTPVVESDGLDDLFYRVELDEEESEHLAAEPYSYWKSVFRVFIKKPSAIISLSVLAILILCIIICAGFAASDEFHQTFVNGRTGQFSDCIIDTLGATIGSILTKVLITIL